MLNKIHFLNRIHNSGHFLTNLLLSREMEMVEIDETIDAAMDALNNASQLVAAK